MSGSSPKYPSLAGGRETSNFSKHDTLNNTLVTGVAGSVVGSALIVTRIALSGRRPRATLRTQAGSIATYGVASAAFAFGEAVSANLRGEESASNSFVGGAAAGAILGASMGRGAGKSLGGALMLGFACAVGTWGFDRSAEKNILGSVSTPTTLSEEHPRQGFWDLVYRRPLSQTVEELGDLAKQIVRD